LFTGELNAPETTWRSFNHSLACDVTSGHYTSRIDARSPRDLGTTVECGILKNAHCTASENSDPLSVGSVANNSENPNASHAETTAACKTC